MMKTKLTLFVIVLAVALLGMGCTSVVETMTGTLFPGGYTVKNDQSEAEPSGNVSERPRNEPHGFDISKGLVAYYPFNGDAKDASRNNHHGEVKGASLGDDRHGNPSEAYYFDGKDDFIEITDSDKLDFGAQGTISFWMKPMTWTGGSKGVISKKSSDGEPGLVIYRNTHRGGQVTLRLEPIGSTSPEKKATKSYWSKDGWTNSNVELERWEHWCATWNGAKIIWYRNAKVDVAHTKNWVVGTYGNEIPLHIGHAQVVQWGAAGRFFHGSLDDIRIYNMPLSEEGIRAIYKLEKPSVTGPSTDEIAIENAIRLVLNMPSRELGQNDYARVRELDLSNKKIHNISSLSLLPKLKKLNLRGNLVADFQPLTKLSELEYLFVSTDGVSIDHLHRLGKLESVTELHLERTHNMNNGTYISALAGKSPNLERLHLYLPGLYDRSPIYGCKSHAKLKLIDMTYAPQPKDVRDALIKHFNPDKEIMFKETK